MLMKYLRFLNLQPGDFSRGLENDDDICQKYDELAKHIISSNLINIC